MVDVGAVVVYRCAMEQEEWRPVLDGFYEASSLGRIRRAIGRTAGRVLSQSMGPAYLKVTVCIRGRETTIVAHRLVAMAFHPQASGLNVVNHMDGNKFNNRPENLEWTTPAGNSAHAAETGLAPSGDRHGRSTKPERTARGGRVNTAVMTESDVIEARSLRSKGWTLPMLCAKFGINKSGMHAVCTRKNWKHIP